MPDRTIKNKRIEILLVAAVFAATYVKDLPTVPFHGDESQWIATSDQLEAYASGQFRSPLFSASYWTLTQPPMARYAIGISRRIGGYRATDLNATYDFRIDSTANQKQGRTPSASLLWWSRIGMAVLAAASMVILFALLITAFGRPAAYTFTLLALPSPYFLLHLRRAMGEATLLFFVVLSLTLAVAAMRGASRHRARASLSFFGLFGVCAGLAAASKLNGGSIVLGGLALVVFASLRLFTDRRSRVRYIAIASLFIVSGAAAAFVIVNPYLWPNPPRYSARMLNNRISEMRFQQGTVTHSALNTISERLTLFPHAVVRDTPSTRFVGWLGTTLLAAVGVTTLIRYTVSSTRTTEHDETALAVLGIGITASAPAFTTLVNWPRYELLPVLFLLLLVAIGTGSLVSFTIGHVRKRVRFPA